MVQRELISLVFLAVLVVGSAGARAQTLLGGNDQDINGTVRNQTVPVDPATEGADGAAPRPPRAGARPVTDTRRVRGDLPPPDPLLPDLPVPPEPPALTVAREQPDQPEDAAPAAPGPYDPLGIRVGGLRLYPETDIGVLWSDSVDSAGGAPDQADTGLLLRPSFKLESDWVRHAFSLTGEAEYEDYIKGSSQDTVSTDIEAKARIDIRSRTKARLNLKYGVGTADRGDPDVPDDATELPDVHEVSGAGELEHRFNRLRVSLRGSAIDLIHEDATLASGGIESNADRDYVEVAGRLRAGYEISPAYSVFAEATVSERLHDQTVDDNGERRDWIGTIIAAGGRLELSPVTEAEMAIGYISADFDDPGLRSIGDVYFRGELTWRPSVLTTVRAAAGTTVEDTTDAGVSGSVQRTVSLDLEHAVRENIVLNAGFAFSNEDFEGSSQVENTYDFKLGALYRLNRHVAISVEYTRSVTDSSEAGEDTTENAVFVGLNLRR